MNFELLFNFVLLYKINVHFNTALCCHDDLLKVVLLIKGQSCNVYNISIVGAVCHISENILILQQFLSLL